MFSSSGSCSTFWRKFVSNKAQAERLEHKAIRTFVKCDLEIQGIAPFRKDHISRISRLVLRNLDDFQELEGKHGPGAVAEGHKSNQKWLAFVSGLSDLDPRLEKIGYDLTYGLYRDRLLDSGIRNVPASEDARLVTVPKSSSSLRTITVEPVLNQFVQQAYNSHLRKEIDRCSVMSRCLALATQEPNQKLAIEGSLTGEWVTVDLSAASDRLSTELVELAFTHRPRFLSGIMSCRTPFVSIRQKRIELKKYAGMGNATTFPIQSYVFALIALCSMIGTNEVVSIGKLEALASNIRVFGDDIVIKRRYFPAFVQWIESCGLKINQGKTFSQGNFRESCGVDAYMGTKVTPIYMRYDPLQSSTDTKSFVGTLSTCNQLWLAGLYATSDFLRTLIEAKFKLPLVHRECPGLGLHTHQDLCERQRWSDTLHRYEVKTYVLVPVRERDEIDGYAALMKYFHSPCSGEFDVKHLSSSVRRFNSNLRKRWVPAA